MPPYDVFAAAAPYVPTSPAGFVLSLSDCIKGLYYLDCNATGLRTFSSIESQGKLGTMGDLVGKFGNYGICGDVCKYIANNKDVVNAEYVQTARFPEKKRIVVVGDSMIRVGQTGKAGDCFSFELKKMLPTKWELISMTGVPGGTLTMLAAICSSS